MTIIEQSKNLKEVVQGSNNIFLNARFEFARCRLEIEVGRELIATGLECSNVNIKRIIDGLPNEVLISLLVLYS
jgi:hypothetical protein